MLSSPFNHISLLRFTGLFTYACTGMPLLSATWRAADILTGSPEYVGWCVAYAIFGLAYWFATNDLGRRRPGLQRIPLLIVMNIAAFAIAWFSHSGISGILTMLIAGVVPWTLPLQPGVAWVVLQSYSLVPIFVTWGEFSLFDAFVQCSLYMGFSAFTYVTSLVAKQQADSRDELRRLNSELRATRTLLTESSRIAERMRISRDLHDLIGHHLTALSLNLEVASHLVGGTAQEHVRQAQSVAKLLLSDVREVVSQLRENDNIDLTEALRTLVEGVPGLAIHLELPPRFSVDDPLRAQVLLRCAQEIITNTVRHAGARHLWLRVYREVPDLVVVEARDDGVGAETVNVGNGLRGMRERLQQCGGQLQVETRPGEGFRLRATVPATVLAALTQVPEGVR